jgi:translation initiation factor 4G
MDFLHFFAYLLFPEWVFRLFYSVPSTTQTHEADSNLLPDVTSGSQLSSETNPNTEKVSEPIGSHYQTESNDSVLEEEIKNLREELRLMTVSRDSLLVKNRKMKFHALSRITTISQLKSKIVLLESEIQALTHSLVQRENQTPLTSDKDSNNLSSAHADQEPSIPDIKSQEDPMKESFSLSKTYDREFLLHQRTSFLSQKKPDGIFPVAEIVRETVAPKRNVVSLSSIETIGAQVTEAPRRELKLTPVIIKERAASNEWRPKHSSIAGGDEMTTAVVLKTVRGLLNKMTPSKHEKLFAQIENLPIDTEERLAGVIQLFFEKAISEPFFAPTYAKMCHSLSQKAVPSCSTDGETSVSFRNLLLAQCKKEFDRDGADRIGFDEKKTQIRSAENEEKKNQLKMELQDLVDKNRRRVLGNITFIGELFRVGTISEQVIHRCIRRLITSPGEQEIEKLCVLMSTIGKDLENGNQNSSDVMNSHYRTLEYMAVDQKLSNRIRFMITDLIELRCRQWKSREESKLEGQNPSHVKTRVTGSQHVNTTKTTPTVIEKSSKAVDENTPVFAYSDFRLKNQLVTGYSVIPTGCANRKLEVISDPIPAQKSTVVEPIPKPPPLLQENNVTNRNYDFAVASSVKIVEFKNRILLKNIAPADYGRIVGRERTNEKRLTETYGTFLNSKKTNEGSYDFTISGSSSESRREAVDDVIESLPLMIEFEQSKIDHLQRYRIKQIAHSNFVRVNMPKLPHEKVTIVGKLKNCENAFNQLVRFSAK